MINTIDSSSNNKKQWNLAKQTEAIGETIKSNTDQLKTLGFTCSQYDEDKINKIDGSIILKIKELIQRWVLLSNWNQRLNFDQVESIQKNYNTLVELHNKWLKMTADILYDIGEITIFDQQVDNFIKYKIKVTDANDLTQNARYNHHRQCIQWFIDSWYELTENGFQHLNAYTPRINFNNLQKLNTLLGRKISIDTVITPKEDDDGLNGCWDMENFDWEWLTYLTKNQISIPDNRLRKFKYQEKINKNNFQKLIDEKIKIPPDAEIFDHMNIGITFLSECTKIYLYNHSKEHTEEEINLIKEKFSKQSFITIEIFIQIYQQIEEEIS